jgi:hypothetical protein
MPQVMAERLTDQREYRAISCDDDTSETAKLTFKKVFRSADKREDHVDSNARTVVGIGEAIDRGIEGIATEESEVVAAGRGVATGG